MIIGIAGKARAGKTTIANYIRDNYGFTTINFADPIKRGLEAMLDLTPKTLDELKISGDPIIPDTNINVRKLLQTLGTEWGREIVDENFWTELAGNEIKKLENQFFPQNDIVIGDVRFVSEFKWIQERYGVVIFVNRERKIPFLDHENHKSETELDLLCGLVNYTVDNSKSHASLFRQIDGIMKELNYRKSANWLITLSKLING